MERGQHRKNFHAEGDNSQLEERPQPGHHRKEPRLERRMEVPRREERNEMSRLIEDPSGHQFPFTKEIMATKFPSNWNNPTLDKYDGSTDLDEHIDAYVSQLTLFTIDGYMYYKVFLTSLRGATLSWFTRIPPRSIDSFVTLKAKFIAQFATSKPHQMTSVTLVHSLQPSLNTDLIKEPKRGVSPQHADRSKYCRYHRSHSHTIGEYAALRDKIEELIQAGQLQRYVARGRQYGWREERNPKSRSPGRGIGVPRIQEEVRQVGIGREKGAPPAEKIPGKQ